MVTAYMADGVENGVVRVRRFEGRYLVDEGFVWFELEEESDRFLEELAEATPEAAVRNYANEWRKVVARLDRDLEEQEERLAALRRHRENAVRNTQLTKFVVR